MKKILTLLIIAYQITAFAQLLPIRTYFTDDGLASSQVWSITQEKKDYLWFGCSSGVSRFNGFEFENYRTEEGLPSGSINTLISLNDGSILVVTGKGICLKTENEKQFKKLPDIGEISDTAILYSTGKNGKKQTVIFVSVKNKGIYFSALNKQKWEYFGLKKLNPTAIATIKDNLFFISSEGNLYLCNIKRKKPIFLWNTGLIKKIKTSGTTKKLLIGEKVIYRIKKHDIEKIAETKGLNEIFFDAAYDSRNNLWIGTNLGLKKISGNKEKIFNSKNGLPGKRVLSVFVDSGGILWFGTNHGVCKLVSEDILVFKNPFNPATPAFFSFYYDKKKQAMLIGHSSGVLIVGKNRLSQLNSNYIKNFPVWDITQDDKGNYYFATEGGGVVYKPVRGKEKYYRKENGCLPGNNVTDILIKKDKIYFSLKEGFAVMERNRWKIYDMSDGLPVSYVRCLENYKDNSILLAPIGSGILIFKNNTFKNLLKQTPQKLKTVYDIYYDWKNDIIWAATNYGLAKIKDNKTIIYSSKNGFLPFGLTAIFPVKNYLWIGSDGGAQLFDPQKEKVIKIITRDDGLPGNEFTTHNAIAKDDKNRIWFGFFGGVASIERLGLTTDQDIDFKPKVFVTSVKYSYRNNIVVVNNLCKNKIHIPYGAKEIFISFDPVWFRNEYNLTLAYKLKGINSSWNTIKNFKDMKIYYTSITPGNYSLFIKLSSIATNKLRILKILDITIPTPWWIKPEFRFAGVILFLLLSGISVFLYTEYKTKKLKKEKEKLNRKVRERTRELNRVNRELEKKNKILKEMAEKDFLTGLYNRRFFMKKLSIIKNIAEREKDFCLCIIIMDIDNFKETNDTYGHTTGDEVLKIIATEIKRIIKRKIDLAARYGGEEFIVALVKTNKEKAREIAEDIRETIEKRKIQYNGHSFSVTISGGFCCVNLAEHPDKLDETIECADKNLYLAKKSGKNKVVG